MRHNAVPPTSSRLLVKRGGSSITRAIPKPVVLVDTREHVPFEFHRFDNWIASTRVATLPVGDYSVEGMESLLVLERKSLTDLIGTLMHHRERFFRQCERMAAFRLWSIRRSRLNTVRCAANNAIPKPCVTAGGLRQRLDKSNG